MWNRKTLFYIALICMLCRHFSSFFQIVTIRGEKCLKVWVFSMCFLRIYITKLYPLSAGTFKPLISKYITSPIWHCWFKCHRNLRSWGSKGSQIEPQKDFNAFPSCLFFWRIKEGKEANGSSPIATFFPQGISYLVPVPLANKGESYLAPMVVLLVGFLDFIPSSSNVN